MFRLPCKSDRSKAGASDSDITKSARYVLSNKYFNKKDSIKILEDYIKNGEKTAINGDPSKKSFMKEVMRSSKSGYLADVLLKVNYLDSGKKLTGKCGKVLCSKEYNNYIARALTGSAGSSGNVDYGRIVSEGLRYVVIEVQKDLEYGLKVNDYILDKNKDNLIKFIEDIERCNVKCYNLLKMVYELAWFVGGDANKIRKLQATLRRQGYSQVVQDGVYGAVTEKAWLEYVNKTLEPYSSYNFTVGISAHVSGHAMAAGGDLGLGIYIDEDFNIAIMGTVAYETSTGFDVAGGGSLEWSTTAMTLDDLAGNSVSSSTGGRIPFTVVDGSVGQSRSIYNGNVVVNSVSLGGSVGTTKYGINTEHQKLFY